MVVMDMVALTPVMAVMVVMAQMEAMAVILMAEVCPVEAVMADLMGAMVVTVVARYDKK
jgi:hypothetical protein